MADNFFKIDRGVTLAPQASVSTPQNGDVYYDSARATYVFRNNGQNVDLQKRTDVATAASLTSADFTSSVIQSSLLRLTGSTVGDVHGFAASSDAKTFIVYNNSSVVMTFKNQSGTEGTAANRIALPNGADITLAAGRALQFSYDSAQSRWILISSSASSGSGSGGVNFILNPDGEAGTAGWSTYADAAVVRPTDGTGGSPTVTWTTSSSAPLAGLNSFVFTHPASNTLGQGVSYQFSVDQAYRAKVITISMDYIVRSGTFVAGSTGVDGDLIVYIYDVTNSQLIEPSSFKFLSNSSTISNKFQATFQTSATGSSYRLILHSASSLASAYTLGFDNFNVGPSTYVFGTPVTDWVSWTPTGSWTTTSTYTGQWRQVGDTREYKVKIALAGAATAANLAVNLPAGHVIDTAKLPQTTAGTGTLGYGSILDSGVAIFPAAVNYSTTTQVALYTTVANATFDTFTNITQAVPTTFGASDAIDIQFSVPIVGLSSSVQMSDQTDTRIVLAKYRFTSAKTSAPASPFNFDNLVSDTHGAVTTGASWKFTAPIPGKYFITVVHASAGTAVTSYIYKNGIQSDQLFTSAFTANNGTMNGTAQIDLNAGEYIDVRLDTSVSVNSGHIIISRVSGPAAIAATESVNVSYGSTAGSTIGGSYTLQTFTANEIDTHGAWNGTDTFTAPIAGQYSIGAGILTAAVTLTTSQSVTMAVYKNGVLYRNLDKVNGTGASTTYLLNGSDLIRLKAGETLQIYAVGSVATSQSTSSAHNRVNIVRVGN